MSKTAHHIYQQPINNPRKLVINREKPGTPRSRSTLGTPVTGIMEREKAISDLKKENFGLKMRIYYLSQNIQNLTPAGMQHIIHQHAEFKSLVEEWKNGRQYSLEDIPEFGSNPLASRKKSTVINSGDRERIEEQDEKIRAQQSILVDNEAELQDQVQKNNRMVAQLRKARKVLKMMKPYVTDLDWIVESVNNGTKWIDDIHLAYLEKALKKRLGEELRHLKMLQEREEMRAREREEEMEIQALIMQEAEQERQDLEIQLEIEARETRERQKVEALELEKLAELEAQLEIHTEKLLAKKLAESGRLLEESLISEKMAESYCSLQADLIHDDFEEGSIVEFYY